MKALKQILLCLGLVLCITGTMTIKADNVASGDMTIQSVSDISEINGDINYQSIGVSSITKCATLKLNVTQDGMVKIIGNASGLSATYISNDGSVLNHNLQVTTRIFRNAGCVDQAGADVVAFRNRNSDTGSVFLTKGIYYVQFEASDPSETDTSLTCSISGNVKAATYFQTYTDNQKVTDLKVTKVSNVEMSSNVSAYQQLMLSNVSKCAVAKLTIQKAGAVKLITNASNITDSCVDKGVAKTTALNIATRLYQNAACTKQVGKEVTACQNKASETKTIYLEKGTYYIQYDAGNASKDGVINGTLQVAALYQPYATAETISQSTIDKRNTLAYSKVQKGFLSDIAGTDYYQFKVTKLIPVKLWCRTFKEGKTTLQLYNSSFEKLASKSGSASMEQIGFEKYLNIGTYYVKVDSSAKGTYEISLSMPAYHLSLTYKMPFVSVHTIADYSEIRYLKGSYYNIPLDSAQWKKGVTLGKNKTSFSVNQTGYYTVRVTDSNGKQFLKMIYIKKADSVKPAKPTVTSYRSGQSVLRGKAEKNSTIYVQMNAYKTIYKAKVSANGTYKVALDYYMFKGDVLKVYAVDRAGNKSAVRKVRVK